MEPETLCRIVARARLAPSVHNVQPARWRVDGDAILIAADLGLSLPASDPTGRDIGLSCGAAVEATVIALMAEGIAADAQDLWPENDQQTWPGHRIAARLVPTGAVAVVDASMLEQRFTHRGRFLPADATDWTPADAMIVSDRGAIATIARAHDVATARVLADDGQRGELLHWMRISPGHARAALDGMALSALRMGRMTGIGAALALGPLWPVVRALGLGGVIGAEAANTRSAVAIALFHRPAGESPVTSGRAYMRLWLDATARGWAGWPMAALTDDPQARDTLTASHPAPAGRQIIQALRFGPADAAPPPRARLPVADLMG